MAKQFHYIIHNQNALTKVYENKWYKVWFRFRAYNGRHYSTYTYAFGDAQVKATIKAVNGYKVSE